MAFEFPEVLNDDGDFVGFDVVIGNPPYLPSNKIEKLEKKYLVDNYETSEYQINTFGLFAEKGIKLLKLNGIQCYIIPNYWLSTKYDEKLRNYLFNIFHTHLLVNVYSVFESATVDTLIAFTEKNDLAVKKLHVISIDRKLKNISNRLDAIHFRDWAYEKIYDIKQDSKPLEISFGKKIIPIGETTIGQIFNLKFGAKLYEVGKGIPSQTKEFSKNKIYESNFKKDDTYVELLRARDIKRYKSTNSNYFVKYGDNLAAPRNSEIFINERILIQRIVSKRYLDATIEFSFKISNTDVITLHPKKKNIDMPFYLGIVCSRFLSYVIKSSNVNLDRDAFPKINTDTLASFPIPDNHQLQDQISILVKEVLNSNSKIDTSELEAQIDQLVYQLYDLTEEEIKIVENN